MWSVEYRKCSVPSTMSANSLNRRCSYATARSCQYHCLPNTGWKRRPSDGCLRSMDLSELFYGLTYDKIYFERHLMTPVLKHRYRNRGARNLYRSSKRHVLVCHCCLVVGAARSLRKSAAPGIQEFDPVGVDEIPVVLGSRLFVVPRLRALPAFEINAGAFVKVFAGDLCQATEGLHGKPFRVFLRCAVFVLPSFRGGDGKLRYGRSLLAVLNFRITAEISDQQNLLHGV